MAAAGGSDGEAIGVFGVALGGSDLRSVAIAADRAFAEQPVGREPGSGAIAQVGAHRLMDRREAEPRQPSTRSAPAIAASPPPSAEPTRSEYLFESKDSRPEGKESCKFRSVF